MRVMVVDDSVAIRDVLVSRLARIPGVDVVGLATDADQAISAFDRLRPDVMVLDLLLPGDLDGLDVLRHTTASEHEVRVVVLTGAPGRERACLDAGAAAFLEKPDGIPQVLQLISSWADEGDPPERSAPESAD